ncbi:hypothetical protein SVAN01_03897 [Stagonosporopsis vannaccii]|nr:hypothetical protein SVAN01_03897 [Stagonosporopsis vannaccii]
MTILRTLRLLALVGCGSAFVARNDAIDVHSAPLPATGSDNRSTWKPKVHGESSAHAWDVSAIGSESRIRLEPTATDFDVSTPTAAASQGPQETTGIVDIGSAIGDLIITETDIAKPVPTVHWEDSASGWDDITSTVHVTVSSELAHFESSADPWGRTRDEDSPKPHSSRYIPVVVTDDPWTRSVRPPQVTRPGGPADRQPQVTTLPTRIITDFPPLAAVTYDGITMQPTLVTRRPTVAAPDGAMTTTAKIEFQVAVGSSTLKIGTPITVNNIVVILTTNAAGSTVLHAGDLATTLLEPTAGDVRTVAGEAPGRLSIMTSIVSGTTKYVLAGQTLAPGQPVTISGTPISIATDGDNTVLYVGNKTTTLSAGDDDLQIITDLDSVSAKTQGTGANSGTASADPTSTRSGSSQLRDVDTAFAYCVMGMAMIMFTA